VASKWINTPSHKINPVDVLKIENVDERREVIRKIGIERMLSALPHKVLDSKGDYSLLSIDFPDLIRGAKYLKMLNPSIGVWHLEGVAPSCNTVQQALNWRADRLKQFVGNKDWQPSQLT
jgi:hypothetical protein